MWMRGEQLKILSALFSPRIQRENGETEIVSGMKKKGNTKIYLISIRESCSEGWIKTKEPPWLCGTSHTQNQGHSGLLRTKHWHGKNGAHIMEYLIRNSEAEPMGQSGGISSQSLWNMFQRSTAEIRTHSNGMNTPSNNQYPHVESGPILCFVRRNAMHEAV